MGFVRVVEQVLMRGGRMRGELRALGIYRGDGLRTRMGRDQLGGLLLGGL